MRPIINLVHIVLFLLLGTRVYSQPRYHATTNHSSNIIKDICSHCQYDNSQHVFFKNKVSSTSAKSTALGSTIIADCIRELQNSSFEKYDSMRYFFSGLGHAEFDTYPKKCDSMYIFHYPQYTNDSNGGKIIQPINTNGDPSAAYYMDWNTTFTAVDTIYYDAYTYDNNSDLIEFVRIGPVNNVWTPGPRDLYTYDADHNVLTSIHQHYYQNNTWTNEYKYVYTYDINNNVTSQLYQEWVDPNWVNAFSDSSAYNNTGDLIFYEARSWDTTTSSFLASMRAYTQYNNNGCPYHSWTESLINGNWTWSSGRYSTYYPGTCDMLSDTPSYYNINTNQIELGNIFEYGPYVAPGCPSSLTYYIDDQGDLVPVGTEYYLYNSYDQRTRKTWDEFDGVDYNTKWYHSYYYEEYDFPANVNVTKNVSDIRLYPVPAINTMYVALQWNEPQPFNITIYQMTGNAVRTWNVETKTDYYSQLDLTGLVSGMYFIECSGTKEKIVKKFSIVR